MKFQNKNLDFLFLHRSLDGPKMQNKMQLVVNFLDIKTQKFPEPPSFFFDQGLNRYFLFLGQEFIRLSSLNQSCEVRSFLNEKKSFTKAFSGD